MNGSNEPLDWVALRGSDSLCLPSEGIHIDDGPMKSETTSDLKPRVVVASAKLGVLECARHPGAPAVWRCLKCGAQLCDDCPEVELIGLNEASETIVDKLAIHDKPGALERLMGH